METQPKKVKYREYDFGESVTMMSIIGTGYLSNGQAVQPKNSELTLFQLMKRIGNQGWELMSVRDSQYYLFKRVDTESDDSDKKS